MPEVTLPQYSEVIRRNILIDELGGPKDVFYYLENFPEELYNKSPDSHLYKYMRSLLGEAGVNWLKKNYLEARLLLEELGMDAFDLDKFFGSPFSFGRIVEEDLSEDPYGIIPKDEWERIKAQNARYRNRALDYMNGARAGNTTLGMKLVSKAGIGHEVEIVENYKYLFDAHSDDPLGLAYQGRSLSTEEMIILPRREVGLNEQVMIFFAGDKVPDSGSFYIVFNGEPSNAYSYNYDGGGGVASFSTIPFDASPDQVRLAIESLHSVDPGDIVVTGGPGPMIPWTISFQGAWGNKDAPDIEIVSSVFSGSTAVDYRVLVLQGGQEAVDEVVNIPAKDIHNLMSAVDRIRPQTTLPTVGEARGLRSRNNWRAALPSSEYSEVVRFVAGNPSIQWPTGRQEYWIRPYQELQSPRLSGDLQYHYAGFHNIAGVEVSSLNAVNESPDKILADYTEPLFVTASTEQDRGISLVNGIYPTDYQDLPGAPQIRYREEQFWSSKHWDLQGGSRGMEQDEWVILRFPFIKAVNYLSFDIHKDDVQIDLEYDAADGTETQWVPVTPVEPYSNIVVRGDNTWASLGLTFTDRLGQFIWTNKIRIKLHRTTSVDNYWGYPIKIRNLRLARNI